MAVNDQDVAEWKGRFNDVLARPAEHVNHKSSGGSWLTSFFGCCDPIDLCLVTYCLPCVTFGKTHHRLRKDPGLQGYEPINTSCLLLCGTACFGLHWIPMSMQRADIRDKFSLDGSCLVDIAASCCCSLCTLVQAEKEVMAHAGDAPAAGVKQEYQAPGGMTYPAAPAAASTSAPAAPVLQ